MHWVMPAMTVGCVVAGYVFWVRPILRSTPALRELFAREETAFAAVRAKFAGIKQRLAGAVVILASVVVAVHDQLAPIVAGVDVTPLAQLVPPWAWPLILIGVTWALQGFRRLADRGNAAAR